VGRALCRYDSDVFALRTGWDLRPNPLTDALARHGGPVLDLSESNPTRCGFRYESERILASLASPEALRYRPDPRGLEPARAAIADYYRERGIEVGLDQLVLTASTSEGYSHLFRLLCNAGDRVHIPSPGYPLFDLLAAANDVSLGRYHLFHDHGWHFDAHELASEIQPFSRALLVVSPNNPTGSYCKRSEWERMQELAERADLAVIVDEVFFDYALDGKGAGNGQSPAAEAAEGRAADDRCHDFIGDARVPTFVLNGLSKIAGLPQMKLAWIVVGGPAAVRAEAMRRLEIISDTYLSVDTPVQWATGELLETRRMLQPQIRERIRANLERLDRRLARVPAADRLLVEGGWYGVVRVPETRSDEEWALMLLARHDVLVHPGHFYEFPAGAYLVLSLITPEEAFEEGARRLASAIASAD
jgi:alanine-synthesizing transaminase